MSLRAGTCIAPLLAIVLASDARAQAVAGSGPASPIPYIEASGAGQVRLAPDRATILIGIETVGATANEASTQNAGIQRAVSDTLRKLGFSGTAVTTSRFEISPQTERAADGRITRTIYVGRYIMTVQLTVMSRIGEVIDASLARGANLTGGIEYSSTKADSAKLAAIAAATANAQRQATALAAALGGSLGPLIQATTRPYDGEFAYGTGSGAQAFGTGTGTAITPTQLTIDATVLVRWRFFGR